MKILTINRGGGKSDNTNEKENSSVEPSVQPNLPPVAANNHNIQIRNIAENNVISLKESETGINLSGFVENYNSKTILKAFIGDKLLNVEITPEENGNFNLNITDKEAINLITHSNKIRLEMHDIFGRKLTSSEKDYVVKLTTSDNLNAEILTISDDNVISISDSKEIFTNVKMRINGLEEENKVVVNLYEEKDGVKYLLDKEEFNTGKDSFNPTKELNLKGLTIGFKHENLKAEIITTDLEGNERVILTEKSYKIAENPIFKISNVTEDNIINLKETKKILFKKKSRFLKTCFFHKNKLLSQSLFL